MYIYLFGCNLRKFEDHRPPTAQRHSAVNYNVLWVNTADKEGMEGKQGKEGKEPIINSVNGTGYQGAVFRFFFTISVESHNLDILKFCINLI